VPSLCNLLTLHTLLSLFHLSIVILCLSLLLQAISKKKEDDVDKGSFYPTPPESVGEQSQGMVCLLGVTFFAVIILWRCEMLKDTGYWM
jgi:hypothetical protein